jgi:hypothetical protein
MLMLGRGIECGVNARRAEAGRPDPCRIDQDVVSGITL